LISWIDANRPFPPLSHALREPNGLLAAGGDLSIERLLEAYRRGIFPWFSDGDPILWWSPDPRMVLFPAELKISRSLAKTLRRNRFRLTADRAFGEVIDACRAPRPGQDGTWITGQMSAAYRRLHEAGHAHSVEAWLDDELAGGLYGVALGRAFFGESMFARVTDASKVALVALVRQLARWRFGLIDCQMNTPHLASLGAREIPREDFARRLAGLVDYAPVPGPWRIDALLT
jgi:leucyl/phenylalanyl-tRNA--protein transferase